MSTRPPVVPVRGTEAQRLAIIASHPELVAVGEQVFTTDQQRLWLRDTAAWLLISAPVHHGDVATEAAMLALETTATAGVWPGDTCYRTDAQSTFRNLSALTWEPYTVAGLTTVTEQTATSFRLILGTGVTVTEQTETSFKLSVP